MATLRRAADGGRCERATRRPVAGPRAARRRGSARGGPARGVRAAGRGDLRGLPAALRRAARGALRPRPISACWPATGCMRSAWRGWSRSATRRRWPSSPTRSRSARSRRAPASRRWPTRCGRPGARAVGWGSSEAHRRAKELAFAGAPEAIEAMRTSAAGRPGVALNRASILFGARCPTSTHKHKSKYTLDRQIPGAFEGETVTRRRFMTGTAHARRARSPPPRFTLPALGFAIGPIFKSTPHRWETRRHGRPCSPTTTTSRSSSRSTPGIGEAGKTTVYVRKFNPAIDTDPYDRDTPYIAISSRCAHLGCPVRWVDAAERFICPCHGGVYDLLGRRVGGPPVRPLDRFYTRVERRIRRSRAALQRQQRAAPLLAARPRRAAGRHRPVPVSVAARRAETVGPSRSATVPKLPAPPLPVRAEGAAAAARARTTASAGPLEHAEAGRHHASSTGSTSAPR